jgi:predicted RNase H-like HicB family nuclease
MKAPVISYGVKLEAWFRRDGREWLVWCPAIDVMTQARTKKQALESLSEAVELWFESCIDRGVLDDALKEVGFT